MRVRAIDDNNEPKFGRGQDDFLKDVPAAVGQCVKTRLALYTNEWFLNLADGTPWRTQVLGKRTDSVRDPVLRARILGTNGVTGISSYASQHARSTRAFTVQATVDTIYGVAEVDVSRSTPDDIDVRIGR